MTTLWRWLSLLLCAVALVSPRVARAHEVRPALLQLSETAPRTWRVLWKQPMVGDLAVHLVPHLSGGGLERAADATDVQPGFRIRTWTLRNVDVDGQRVAIEGLADSVTDVLLRVQPLHGDDLNTVIRPADPTYALALGGPKGLAAPAYLRMGVEHILTGFDHLLFVFGLFLIVGPGWRLVKAITAFTAAHSITLALAALGYVHYPSAVIEVLVALSIVFVAWELATGRTDTLAHRKPWLIAFSFGLLHGLAFAGALADVGLPQGQAPLALLLFNLGVELGQLSFVALVLVVTAGLRRLPAWGRAERSPAMRLTPAYVIGALSSYWLIERTIAAVALPG